MEGYVLVRDQFESTTDAKPSVNLFWGVERIDKSKTHPFNSSYAGEIVLDTDFNLATTAS